ncbi:hypothetical protein RSSM_05885 [Rhodopirellula sallentina SM41]|uniref:Uncharacterized protein n=1 Tax=Rhodopirellula sallentina SM41 TaxID=1263870 RepID=M5U9K2_9BACT|nr:hypothetical protein RSSM_05885 [Rhodopirellula sallentina SM41]
MIPHNFFTPDACQAINRWSSVANTTATEFPTRDFDPGGAAEDQAWLQCLSQGK